MSELIGRKLGKYMLEAQLGEGGMAAVFQSQHPQFHRPVAIKILPPTIGQDPSFRTRFEREGAHNRQPEPPPALFGCTISTKPMACFTWR